ncbi:MAG TPA: hypothetical protein VGF48_15635 [Thermoanaerobaculia bacterium]|jgi:hypothetical protein
MSNDIQPNDSQPPSTEEQNEKIEAIDAEEALGYEGTARGEHSGQDADSAPKNDRNSDRLADNRPEQLK